MKRKLTTVSIKEERGLPKELQELIRELGKKAVDLGFSQEAISSELAKVRREYKDSLIVIPEETSDEKSFREKAIAFFGKIHILPHEVVEYYAYQFEYANYHIETVCAAYRLFNSNSNINIRNIFESARYRMKTSEHYDNLRAMGYRRSIWRITNRKENIVKLKEYFEYLTDDLLNSDEELSEKCDEFMNDFVYSANEEVWLKIIFIISNS